MPTTVKIRRSGTASATPSALEYGEIAINYADGKVFWKNASDVITSFTFQSYALASHTHAASDIQSGTLDIARIPTGSTSSTVCLGSDARLSDTRTPTDNTVSTAKIQNDAVTYAKLQNVSATDRLLGRSSAGAGDVEEITCTSFGRSLIDDADAAAARTTLSVQPTASPTFTGTFACGDTVNVGTASTTNTIVNVGAGATGNRFAITDYIGDTTYTDFGMRVGRNNGGANGNSIIEHRGTGNLLLNAIDAGTIQLATSNEVRATISSTGTATFAGQLLVTAGSVSACSVAPSGDPNTGLVFPSADVLTAVTNGGERMRIAANGDAQIGGVNVVGLRYFDVRNTDSTLNSGSIIRLITRNAANTSDTSTDLLRYNHGLFAIVNNDNGPITLNTGGTERVRVDASGNVGIGTTATLNGNGRALHVHASAASNAAALRLTNAESGSGAADGMLIAKWTDGTNYIADYESKPIYFEIALTRCLSLETDQSIGMPGVYDDIVGATNRDLFIDSAGKLGYVSSIRESKTDIVTLDDVSWLSALSPVSYRYRKRNADGTYSGEADGVTDYGLIAEDVEAVKPELCFYDDVDGEPQLRGVTYSKLITPMLRYIQQLEQRIAALEERING